MVQLYEMRQVQKCYNAKPVLRVASLDIASGDRLCLVGPTGAGKSTLLRLLAGLEPPSSGTLSFAEQRFDQPPLPLAVQRRLTLVFQRPLLLTGTVETNVEYGLRLRGVRPPFPEVAHVLEQLGLTPLRTQSAHTLSGGQSQLVALARALVLRPEVLLLDEPTAHLDPAHVALVEQVLTAYHQESHATLILATHNLFQAKRWATRVALVWAGELLEVADTATFFERPTQPHTVAFVQGRVVY